MKPIVFNRILLLLLSVILFSCRKEFLDKKSDSTLQIPATLPDLRALLDNERVINETPVLGELSADNFYLPQTFWATALSVKEKNGYVWAKDVYKGMNGIMDWDRPYQQVFYANTALEVLEKIAVTDTNINEWNDIKGTALFIRAYAFYNAVQIFAPVYYPSNEQSLGIVLRLASDITQPSRRATLKESYDRIISDLMEAVPFLQNNIQTRFYNRPSKAAVYALLARIFLSMGNYEKALEHADNCLLLNSYLLGYDTVSNLLFSREVLYQSRMLSNTNVFRAQGVPCYVDSTLYNSYDVNDRRRALYFSTITGTPTARAGYSPNLFMFSGLATDEVYLIKAESLARTGNYIEGINVLNSLLSRRFADTDFMPVAASNQQEAVDIILLERRKELVFRGLRWTDLKRLNKQGAHRGRSVESAQCSGPSW